MAALSLSAVAAFGLAPNTTLETVPTHLVERDLPAPPILSVKSSETTSSETTYWREERVRRGDTIGSLLARAGVDDADAMQFLRVDPSARPVYQLRPGRAVRVATDEAGLLLGLRFQTGDGELLAVDRSGDALRAARVVATEDLRTTMRTGEIRTSLFAAADAAGVPDAITIALAEVFAGDIDFYHDLRRGDRFTVVYETRLIDGEPVGTGRILAAEFVNKGDALRVFRWAGDDGDEGYYREDGRSARGAFLRSPMEFSRVTSGFSLARFHPILKQWRAHRGTDYAAPTGTPVRATSDGVVTFAGVQGGYGKVIFLRHDGSYSTVYGHLSRFAAGVRNGVRVRQGETIGHVGQTGWATGPHLHYEFRIGGEARNPLTVALPASRPVPAASLAAFRAHIAASAQTLELAQQLTGATLAATE